MKESLQTQVESALLTEDTEDGSGRKQALVKLRDGQAPETLGVLVALLGSPNQLLRRRACSGLSFFRDFVAGQVEAVAAQLLHNSDPRVRLSCAIHLIARRPRWLTLLTLAP